MADGFPAPQQTQLTHQRDPLTGLYSQDYMLWTLTELRRRQDEKPVAAMLALLQLENFYEIRGWVGKSEADLLLGDIASLLRKLLPEEVLLCRCQRYEFAVLLPDTSSVQAQQFTERIKQALRTASSAAIPPQLELKCAVGLARFEGDITCAEACFARARHSLTQTLSRQRNTARYGGDGTAQPPTVAQLLALLRERQLRVSYQPIASLRGKHAPFYELRTTCRDPGCCATGLFETAVQNALGERMDRRVTTHGLRLLARHGDGNLRLLVNLTLNSLVSQPFLLWLQQQAPLLGKRPARLIFQISELDLLSAQHHLQSFSESLATLGCGLSVSHFGCTPDPCRYLPLLRAHYVKLDASLTAATALQEDGLEQLQAMTGQLRERGLRAIASQVEKMAVLPLLWSAGIEYVQGNCLAPPGPAMTFRFPQQKTLDAGESGRR